MANDFTMLLFGLTEQAPCLSSARQISIMLTPSQHVHDTWLLHVLSIYSISWHSKIVSCEPILYVHLIRLSNNMRTTAQSLRRQRLLDLHMSHVTKGRTEKCSCSFLLHLQDVCETLTLLKRDAPSHMPTRLSQVQVLAENFINAFCISSHLQF